MEGADKRDEFNLINLALRGPGVPASDGKAKKQQYDIYRESIANVVGIRAIYARAMKTNTFSSWQEMLSSPARESLYRIGIFSLNE